MIRAKTALYHQSGALVEFEAEKQYPVEIKDWIAALLETGFAVRPPGLEPGEQKQLIGFVVRRDHYDKESKETTPLVDLYSANPRATFKILKVYFNTPEQKAAFEAVSGLKLDKLPKYIGTGDIERGKNPELDKLVIASPHPFTVVFKPNPKWNEEDAKAAAEKKEQYMIPKRMFVRWEESTAKPQSQNDPKKNGDGKEATEDDFEPQLLEWRNFLARDPSVQEVSTEYRTKVMALKNKPLAMAVWNGPLAEWRKLTGCEWDKAKQNFVPPKEPEPQSGDDDQDYGNYDGPY